MINLSCVQINWNASRVTEGEMVSCATVGVGYSMDRLGSACMGSVWVLELETKAIRRNYHNKGWPALRHYANQPAHPLWPLRRRPNFTLRDRGVNASLA